MLKKILCILCVIVVGFSVIISAEDLNIMTHYKGVLCEQNFNSYECGVPVGFVEKHTPADFACHTINKTIGKDDTVAIELINQQCEYELTCDFDAVDMKAIELSFDMCFQNLKSEKKIYAKSVGNDVINLMFVRTDGTVKIGNTELVKTNFYIDENEWYTVKITCNLSSGFVKAEFLADDGGETLCGNSQINIGAISSVGIVSSMPCENEMTGLSVDNFIVRGADPVYPNPEKIHNGTETFDGVGSWLDSNWLVQYHNTENVQTSNYGVFRCSGKNGKGAALVSDGKMIELVNLRNSNSSYTMSMSVYFADRLTKRIIAAKGYEKDSKSLSSEISLIVFGTDGVAQVGTNGGSTFKYETGKWYDIEIHVSNFDGSLDVTVCDGILTSHYTGKMNKTLQRLVRSYMYMVGFQGTVKSEWRVDNFLIRDDEGFRFSLENGEDGVPTDIGEVNIEYESNIFGIGPVLLNGSAHDIREVEINGNVMSVKINTLEPGKEYTLSFSGVSVGGSSYKNGYVRFKTAPKIYISSISYKNNTGSLDLPDENGFSAYFDGYANKKENIIIFSALYSKDSRELLELNLKKSSLEEYEKEYDIYMELPRNNENYVYKIMIFTDELRPIGVKMPTVYQRPLGTKVLSDIEGTTGKNVHPRLYVDAYELERIKERVGYDSFFKESYDEILRSADSLVSKEPKAYELPDGTRLLNVSREIRSRAETLGVAYAISGNEKYAKRLYEELENAAHFPDWNPRHFLDTAEMLAAFAIGYDWIYDYVTEDPTKKETIVNAVRDKGFEPLLDDYLNRPRTRSYKWTLATNADNWNVVCNGGGILAAIAFAEELPGYSEQIFIYALPLLEKASKQFAPDGAWFEGVDYWQYTVKYYVDILCALNTAAGCDYGFSDVDGLESTGYFLFAMHGEGGVFNFSDCGSQRVYAPEIFYLANIFNDKKLETLQYSFTKKLNRKLDSRGLMWYKGSGETQVRDVPLDYYFRDTEVCSMRSSHSTDANYIGFHAGRNNLAHAHLDVGSFVLDMNGKRFACDLGSESYNLITTYDWEAYRTRAEGHNTLVINPDINPDQNTKAGTVINRFESSADSAIAVCDMTSAYSDDVKSAIRGIRFLNNRTSVLLQDEVRCIEPSDIWWFMHTQASVNISADGKTATLKKDGVTIYAKILTPDGIFVVMDAKPLETSPQNSAQNANSSFKKLSIYFEDVTDIDIAVEFSPNNFGGVAVVPISEW